MKDLDEGRGPQTEQERYHEMRRMYEWERDNERERAKEREYLKEHLFGMMKLQAINNDQLDRILFLLNAAAVVFALWFGLNFIQWALDWLLL